MAFKEGTISVAIGGYHAACIKSLNDDNFLNSINQNEPDFRLHHQLNFLGLQFDRMQKIDVRTTILGTAFEVANMSLVGFNCAPHPAFLPSNKGLLQEGSCIEVH